MWQETNKCFLLFEKQKFSLFSQKEMSSKDIVHTKPAFECKDCVFIHKLENPHNKIEPTFAIFGPKDPETNSFSSLSFAKALRDVRAKVNVDSTVFVVRCNEANPFAIKYEAALIYEPTMAKCPFGAVAQSLLQETILLFNPLSKFKISSQFRWLIKKQFATTIKITSQPGFLCILLLCIIAISFLIGVFFASENPDERHLEELSAKKLHCPEPNTVIVCPTETNNPNKIVLIDVVKQTLERQLESTKNELIALQKLTNATIAKSISLFSFNDDLTFTYAFPWTLKQAIYGYKSQQQDVTNIVEKHHKNFRITFNITNAFFGIDPAPGYRKELVLHFYSPFMLFGKLVNAEHELLDVDTFDSRTVSLIPSSLFVNIVLWIIVLGTLCLFIWSIRANSNGVEKLLREQEQRRRQNERMAEDAAERK
jgi:hypothetical protein